MTSIRGHICNIQRFSTHDGPGIRTTVFFKGCPLRCRWCHNPEMIRCEPELMDAPRLCAACGRCAAACDAGARRIEAEGRVFDAARCRACFRCAACCPTGAIEIAGQDVSSADVLAQVAGDRVFYGASGGGLTLSGGEPTRQPEFAMALLDGARAGGIGTCVATCGFAPAEVLEAMARRVDLFRWDIKDTDPSRHEANTGAPLAPILDNLRRVDALGAATVLCCVLLANVNLDESHLRGVAKIFRSLKNCRGVELLAYHPLGRSKSQQLGGVRRDDDAWVPAAEQVEKAGATLRDLGVSTTC